MPRDVRELISQNEFLVLKCLCVCNKEEKPISPNSADLSDIATNTGIRDRDDVLRALYNLEGKAFVEPHPSGDFTSNQWKITSFGIKALDVLVAA